MLRRNKNKMTKWQSFKHWLSSVRRHKYLYAVIVVLAYVSYRLFISNYMLVNPIIKKDNYEDPIQLHNDVAICNQALDEAQAAVHANNVAATSDFK